MSFRNNSTYVQRQINRILREYRFFVKIYMNDIVVFNHILKKHLRQFNQIFSLFAKLNITLKSYKTYLSYFIISLLKQKINRFELSTTQKKLIVISKLRFSKILKNLKIYLNMIEWLRDYVSYYVQKVNVLRKRKIMLLKIFFFNKNKIRKNFNRRISIQNSSKTKWNSYQQLQNFFNQLNRLIH